MSSQEPPYPPSGKFVSAVKQSSASLCQKAGVKVPPESIDRLLRSPAFKSSFKRVSAAHGLAFPLKFPSIVSELNFLSLLSLLNFASGYRAVLHEQTGRGAWDNIRAFAFSLYISSSTGQGDYLSAAGMRTIGEAKVAELMGVNIQVERPHEGIPGVTIGKLGGPAYELVKLIDMILKETGKVLQENRYPDLGSFVLEALKGGANSANGHLDSVLEKLVRAIPGFRDMVIVEGQPVYCFKKALFLIHAVNIRFGGLSTSPFPIPDTIQSPAFTDNVLPSLLVHLGVIDLAEATQGLSALFPGAGSVERLETLLAAAPEAVDKTKAQKSSPKEGPIISTEQAYILRAAAIYACERITEYARTIDENSLGEDEQWIRDITLPELDMWIWAVAKDRPDYRELKRFALRNTVYF